MEINRMPGSSQQTPVETSRSPIFLPYQGETYYGLPPIKASHYGWWIVAYFFIGGLASASQFIATIVDLVGSSRDRAIVRAGRFLALAGALISPPLLIADLHMPRRWFNMLRIFRDTSPMSIGSWALTAFGMFSGVVAAGQVAADLGWTKFGRWLARLFELPAAAAAGIVALYTGTLLVATNSPLWAGAFWSLSSLFASSAASTAAAALTLVTWRSARRPGARRLEVFGMVAGLAEFFFALLVLRNWTARRVSAPVRKMPLAPAYLGGVLGLGILLPVSLHALNLLGGRRSRRLTGLAALATLVGGILLRTVLIFGGNRSAQRPRDYFHITQPVREMEPGRGYRNRRG